ncbi:hypothetical protein [Neomoorella thermoacetica]
MYAALMPEPAKWLNVKTP